MEEHDELGHNEDVEFLKQAWINERLAPELLPYEEERVTNVKEALDNQQELLDDHRDRPADSMDVDGEPRKDELELDLLEMELDRVKFILTSYLRCRIHKIEKHAFHIVGNAESYERLSQQEVDFVESYCGLMESHFRSTFLEKLPALYQVLGKGNMIRQPNLNSNVFLKVKENIGVYQVQSSAGSQLDQNQELNKDDIWVGQYKQFQSLVMDGRADLI
eukprot:107314_1